MEGINEFSIFLLVSIMKCKLISNFIILSGMDLAYILPNTSSLSADQDLTMTSLMLPYLCVVILAAISGTVGNVLVIGAVIVNKVSP